METSAESGSVGLTKKENTTEDAGFSATEANAAMATLMENGNASFAGWKLFGTIVGVVLLISMANMRVLAGLKARTILYFLFGGYTLLITYQLLNIYTA